MKNRNYHQAKRKHNLIDELMSKKKAGYKEVHRTLSREDLIIVSKLFTVKPEKIIITTKKIGNPYYIRNNLLKTIHFSYMHGEKTVIKNYKEGICHLLNEHSIHFEIKYIIMLKESE